jgi:hypothetical protein
MVGLVSSLKLPWGSSIDHVVVAVVAGGANRQGRSMRSALAGVATISCVCEIC